MCSNFGNRHFRLPIIKKLFTQICPPYYEDSKTAFIKLLSNFAAISLHATYDLAFTNSHNRNFCRLNYSYLSLPKFRKKMYIFSWCP